MQTTPALNPTSAAAALLRVSLGIALLAHGLMKVMVFTLPGTVGFFESVGFAGWTAYPVTFAEIAAGLALIAGFQTRLAAIAIQPVLIGALSVHAGNGWSFSAPNGGWEYPAFLIVIAAAVALLGEGASARDRRRTQAAPTSRLGTA